MGFDGSSALFDAGRARILPDRANLEQHKAGLVKLSGAAFFSLQAKLSGRHALRYLGACTLLLAGCASLDSDLKSAEAKCAPTPSMTPFVTCLNGMDDPVWQKDSPENETAYKDFAAARLSLAENLDSGKITPTQFSQETAEARAKFVALLTQNARARQQEAERQRIEQEMSNMERPTSAPSDMNNGMDKMGMGM
ncbi:MAG TPA: hypothetical protein VNW15_14425 [Rhizomicrobium sp.]|nr:hypothetical protein [Rhizomicrobium sp.]